jgi:hypothetical protein
MKKIRLDMDALEVSSFATEAVVGQRGTVRGAASGYTCYHTVAVVRTQCLDYPYSYWGEYSCRCPLIEDTDPQVCPVVVGPTVMDDTCPGINTC